VVDWFTITIAGAVREDEQVPARFLRRAEAACEQAEVTDARVADSRWSAPTRHRAWICPLPISGLCSWPIATWLRQSL